MSSLNVVVCAATARTTPPTVIKSTITLMTVNCLRSRIKNVIATNKGPVDLMSWDGKKGGNQNVGKINFFEAARKQ